MKYVLLAVVVLIGAGGLTPSFAQDADGCADHPAIARYPGSVLEWCTVENYMPYKVPAGPVTGYQRIGDVIDAEGRVTRNFYSLKGERTHSEVWKNYADALKEAGFEIIGEGVFTESNVNKDVGGRTWNGVVYRMNPWSGGGAANKMTSGTASSGGSGAVVARKERADDTIYIVLTIKQHSSEEVATLIDIVETKEAETGLVTANADAMGEDMAELGRTVLYGLMFDHNEATLTPASKPALDEIAKFLNGTDRAFYVVGHTDSTGAFSYNRKLSADRALSVREVLLRDYGIAAERLEAHGVGPLVPVFSNGSEGGREKNRRVELVEK
ncbi:MAG: OmpA family protein [Pseudomonadota bacterium]